MLTYAEIRGAIRRAGIKTPAQYIAHRNKHAAIAATWPANPCRHYGIRNTTTNTVTKTRTNDQTTAFAQAEISRGALATMCVTGAVVGLWSFASLASALVVTGGPISLAQSWFGAVIGM